MARGLNVFVNIGAKVSSTLASSASTAERRMGQMASRMKLQAAEVRAAWMGADRAIGGFGRNMRNFTYNASLPAGGLVAMGVRAEYQWQQAGNALEAALDLGPAGKKARREIEAIARSLPGNSAENLGAAVDLAKTGFDPEKIKGTLKTTVMLAKSDPDSVDNKSASDIMTNVMLGMRLKETEANAKRVANLLAYGANKSSSDVRLMGESFKYAGPLASRLGMNAEQLTGIFMTMADAGIKGSESGVALRSAMVRMMRPTKGAMAVLARHNMNLQDYVEMSSQASGDSIVKSLKAQGIAVDGQAAAIQSILNNPNLAGEELTAAITNAVVNGMGEAGSAMDRELIATAVAEAFMSGASKVDLIKFFEDAKRKGFSPADIANFFDARQGARLATLLDDRLGRNINDATNKAGGFLDRSFNAQQQGMVGGWARMLQSFGKVLGALEKAGVFDAIASGMERMAAAITYMAEKHPKLTKFIAVAVAGAAVLGVLAPVLGAVAAGFRMVWGIISFGLRLLPKGGLMARLFGPVGKMGPKLPLMQRLIGGLKGLGPMIGRALAGLGPLLMRGLVTVGPWLVRGFMFAARMLLGPIGWALLAAQLVWTFRKEIAKAWPAVVDWFKDAGSKLVATFKSIDWASVGTWIADRMTFGLATGLPRLLSTARNIASGGQGGGQPPTRQRGGGVSRGSLYAVGERGRELFAPNMSGTIIPARATAAMLALASSGIPATAPASPLPAIGELHIHGANDPASTRRIVREELTRLARQQRGGLHD